MTFEQVYARLRDYRTARGEEILFLLQPQTMESIYNCVRETGARDCLELGTGYGATTCVIAAALEENGGGRVTTVDQIMRAPIGVDVLARHTGLAPLIDAVADAAGYNWFLADAVARQTQGSACEPCFDFCFLDGAHEWGPDALATFLVAKLLRPGAWLALDDLDFKLRGCQPGWESVFAGRSEKELDAHQVGMVFDLVLRQHPDFCGFTVTDAGRTGWARRRGGVADGWAPAGLVLDAGPPPPRQKTAPEETRARREASSRRETWQETFAAADIAWGAHRSPGLVVEDQGSAIAVDASRPDPFFVLPDSVARGRPVDIVSLRLRLLRPAAETLQVFWIGSEGGQFSETRSVRLGVEASDDWRDYVVRINGAKEKRPIRSLRIDLTDGPSSLLWESLTTGGR